MELRQDQSLDIWREALSESVRRDGPDLTARQLALLLAVYTRPQPHTVRGFARDLNISKPAVTRAIDKLSALGLVRRGPDEADKRSIIVQRTVKGAVYLSEFADLIRKAAREVDAAAG